MSAFSYGEEIAGYQKKLAGLLIAWERVIAMPKATDRIEKTEPLLLEIARIKEEVHAAERGWDQALDALLEETDNLKFMGLIMEQSSKNPYKPLYRDAWKLQSEMLQAKIAAHVVETTKALMEDPS